MVLDPANFIDFEFKINKTIADGRYILDKQLGKGGFGRVFTAIDTKATHDIPLAVKTVRYATLPLFRWRKRK